MEIAKEFNETRTRAQCRSRFQAIFQKYKKNPGSFTLTNIKYYQSDTLQKRRQLDIYDKLKAKVNSFIEEQKAKEAARELSEDDDEEDDDEDNDDEGDGRYHITPDGVRVNVKDLEHFMFSLQEKASIKDMPSALPKKVMERKSYKSLGLPEKARKAILQVRADGTVTKVTKKWGRPKAPEVMKSASMIKADKNLDVYFRPVWHRNMNKQKCKQSKLSTGRFATIFWVF